MTASQPLPERFTEYLGGRDAAHADAVKTFLASLTERERVLISDIAVMSYVGGSRHPDGQPQPKRTALLANVIDACFAFPDLYPAVDAVQRHTTSSKNEYFVEVQQPDLTWVQASGSSESYSYITRQAELKRAKHFGSEVRVGWRITSTITGSMPQSEEDS